MNKVIVVTAPEPILSWADAKAHLRQDSDDEQTYVEALIAAATAWIDGPDGWVGCSFGPQLLEWRLPAWPENDVVLPYGPVIEIGSIGYTDPAGSDQDWAFPEPLYFEDVPSVRGRAGDIRIQYWAGYGKRDPNDPAKFLPAVPASIKQAILLLVGQWFHTRSTVRVGDAVSQMPFAVEALLGPFRTWRPS